MKTIVVQSVQSVPNGAVAASTTPAQTTPAETLRAAASYLAEYGWVQRKTYDRTVSGVRPPACLFGAVAVVCYGVAEDIDRLDEDTPQWAQTYAAVTFLDEYVLTVVNGCFCSGCIQGDGGGWLHAMAFNDTQGRTAQDVIDMLGDAAACWDRVHGGAA